jgi:YD repeat-containing protein
MDLDGLTFVVDPAGGYWHGLDYSLTLHGPRGERLVGFDNAHRVERQRRGEPQDHRHRRSNVTRYTYSDAAQLLADFWAEVDAVLKERGVTP